MPLKELVSMALAASMIPKNTCLGSLDPVHLRVLSYNLLAPLYVRPLDLRTGQVQSFAAFLWAEPADQVLAWDARRPRLHQELVDSQADVICLQEVQFELDHTHAQQDGSSAKAAAPVFCLPKFLQLEGYDWRLPATEDMVEMAERNKRVLGQYVAIGNAVLWHRDRLRLSKQDKCSKHQTTRVSICLEPQDGSALAGHLGPCAFTSIHLDATDEAKRVKQLLQAVTISKDLYRCSDLIICGDMNAEFAVGSAVARFDSSSVEPTPSQLAEQCSIALRLESSEGDDEASTAEKDASCAAEKDQAKQQPGHAQADDKAASAAGRGGAGGLPSTEQLEQWRSLHREAQEGLKERRVQLARAPTGPTRACYQHGSDCGPCVSFALDHFLFSSDALRLRALWQTLEADPASAAAGLPNLQCPSDHLPIAATFELGRREELSKERRSELAAAFWAAEAAQVEALRTLQGQLAAEAPATPSAEESGAGGGKGKGKGKPSEAMVAHLQRKRRMEKELKAQLRAEREALAGPLTTLELRGLDELVSGAAGGGKLLGKAAKGQAPATVWVEQGPVGLFA